MSFDAYTWSLFTITYNIIYCPMKFVELLFHGSFLLQYCPIGWWFIHLLIHAVNKSENVHMFWALFGFRIYTAAPSVFFALYPKIDDPTRTIVLPIPT